MKIIANNYQSKDVIRFIREWTELTQKDFGKSINKSYGCIQKYESGMRKITFENFMKLCQKHDIKVTIEKK